MPLYLVHRTYFPKPDDRPIARDLITCFEPRQPASFASRKDAATAPCMETEAFAEESPPEDAAEC